MSLCRAYLLLPKAGLPSSLSFSRTISSQPGRKTRMAPMIWGPPAALADASAGFLKGPSCRAWMQEDQNRLQGR